MKLSAQIESRKRLYDIEEEHWALGRKLLAAMGGTIAPEIDRFTDKIRNDPAYKELAEIHMPQIRAVTIPLVDEFLAHGITERYLQEIKSVVDRQFSSTIGARTHIAMAIFILERMFRDIGRQYPMIGAPMAAQCAKALKLVFLDVFNVIGMAQVKTHEEVTDRRVRIDDAAADFRMAVDEVAQFISAATQQIEQSSLETMHAIQTAAGGAESTSGQIQATSSDLVATAAAADELSVSIEEIDRAAISSLDAVRTAVDQVRMAEAEIRGLVEAVASIGSVAGLINAIADQTNLLALNATIEAARAGEAGRGFAVVASEVKSLAAQTAKATQDIGARIAAIQDAVSRSVGSIGEVSQKLDAASEMAGTIGAAVSQQKVSTDEIARMMQAAVDRTQSIVSASSRVKDVIDRSAGSSDTLRTMAQNLNTQSQSFTETVDDFLRRLRAM